MRTARLLQVLCAAHMQCVVGDVIWTEWASLEGWPPPRARSAVALLERVGYLDSDPKIMIFGGSDPAGVRSDMWTASLNFLPLPSIEIEADPDTAGSVPYNPTDAPVWEEIQATGAWPAARSDHSLTALADGRVLLFGGAGDQGDLADAMNDLWVYDFGDHWSLISRPLNSSTATCDTDGRLWPMKRFGHKTMALGTTMWMFGGWVSGCGQSSVNGELWSYDSDEAVVVDGNIMNAGWQRHRPLSLRPSARIGHSMLSFDGKVGLLGGWDGTSATSDMWSYDPSTSAWTQIRTDNTPDEPPPEARYGATVEPVAGGLVLYGGSDRGASAGTDSIFDDVWVFTFDAEPVTTTRSISESMGDGSGTKTTTTTIRTVATNRNLWMEQRLGNVPAPMQSYHGSLVWGNPGYEHILIVGGTDPDGRPTDLVGVLTLNGEVSSNFGVLIAIIGGGILFVGLVVSAWKCAKRHAVRKIRRRWQNAYLMVNAHLATKKLRAEAEEKRAEDEANGVRQAELPVRRRKMRGAVRAVEATRRVGDRSRGAPSSRGGWANA